MLPYATTSSLRTLVLWRNPERFSSPALVRSRFPSCATGRHDVSMDGDRIWGTTVALTTWADPDCAPHLRALTGAGRRPCFATALGYI
jgi:hypothetical protein